jgi:hypothetical protein
MHVCKEDTKKLANPLGEEVRDNLGFILERLRLVIIANKHNLSVYNKYVAVLQETILILSCSNFYASS